MYTLKLIMIRITIFTTDTDISTSNLKYKYVYPKATMANIKLNQKIVTSRLGLTLGTHFFNQSEEELKASLSQ